MKQLIPPNPIEQVLNTIVFQNSFIIFDLWMIVHFISGFILARYVKKWYQILALLMLYEVFEYLLVGVLFKSESTLNIIWDIIFGMLGFFIARLLIYGDK